MLSQPSRSVGLSIGDQSPAKIPFDQPIAQTVTGYSQVMILTTDHRVWCGIESDDVTVFPSLTELTCDEKVRSMATVNSWFFVVTVSGRVWTMHDRRVSQLPFDHPVRHIFAGIGFLLLVTNDGDLYEYKWEEEFSEIGELTQVPFDHTVVYVAIGSYHYLLLTDRGEVWGRGENVWDCMGSGPDTYEHLTWLTRATWVTAFIDTSSIYRRNQIIDYGEAYTLERLGRARQADRKWGC